MIGAFKLNAISRALSAGGGAITRPLTVTAQGNAVVSSLQSKFGGASALFDGTTGTRLFVSGSISETGAFTIEFWFRKTADAGNLFYTLPETFGRGVMYLGSGGQLLYDTYSSDTPDFNNTGTGLATGLVNNQWYHVAYVRNASNSVTVYLDGVAKQTGTSTINYPTGGLGIGSDGFIGNIDEFRISNTARYTANFLPPEAAFVNDANTKLLIHADTTIADDATTPSGFTRSAVNPKVWAYDDVQFHNFGKFSRSLWSPGTDGTLPLEVRDLGGGQNFHSQATTWEAWVYPIAWTAAVATGEGSANVMGNTGSDGWGYNQFGFNNAGKLTFGYAYNNSFATYATVQEAGTSGVLNAWQHIAMVQSGGTITLYHNGVQKATASVVGTPGYDFGNVRGFAIGSTSKNFRGYLEEIRISWTARYSGSSFTVPTNQFVNDSSTKLLYHNNNTNVPLPNGSYISGHDDADGTYAYYNQGFISAVTAVSLIDGATSTASTIAIPAYAFVNDYAFLFDYSTTTTLTVPSGWTQITTSTTTGIRSTISYKKLISSDLGATITGMAGTTRKILVIVRPNGPVTTVTLSTPTQQATTAVPTNQSIAMLSQTRPLMGFAHYSSTGAITTRTGAGNTREFTSATNQYVKTWTYNSSTAASQTIGMSDGGTNALQGFYIRFS